MERRILLPEEWDKVAPIVTGEFNNAMPQTPAQGGFLAALDGERLAGFVHIESLFHLVSTYVFPDYRRTGLGWDLLMEAAARTPPGFSVALLTTRTRTKMAKVVGAHRVGNFNFYRRDF